MPPAAACRTARPWRSPSAPASAMVTFRATADASAGTACVAPLTTRRDAADRHCTRRARRDPAGRAADRIAGVDEAPRLGPDERRPSSAGAEPTEHVDEDVGGLVACRCRPTRRGRSVRPRRWRRTAPATKLTFDATGCGVPHGQTVMYPGAGRLDGGDVDGDRGRAGRDHVAGAGRALDGGADDRHAQRLRRSTRALGAPMALRVSTNRSGMVPTNASSSDPAGEPAGDVDEEVARLVGVDAHLAARRRAGAITPLATTDPLDEVHVRRDRASPTSHGHTVM